MTAQERVGGPREREPLKAVIRQFLRLGRRDQLAVAEFVIPFVTPGTALGPVARTLAACREAMTCLQAVANRLELPPAVAPTAPQYRANWRLAGATLSATAIIRAFGTWSDATAAFANDRMSLTPAQRTQRRATLGRSRRFEDYIEGVRIFLRTTPPSEFESDYNDFAAGYNDNLSPGALPLVRAATVRHQTSLTWDEARRVARNLLTREEAMAQRRHRREGPGDWGDLVGIGGTAAILGHGVTQARERARQPTFPSPIATHAGKRIWLRADIEAYARGDGRLRNRASDDWSALFASELRARLGLSRSTVAAYVSRYPHLIPPPDGRVGGAYWWWRNNVDAWCKAAGSHTRARPISRHDGRSRTC